MGLAVVGARVAAGGRDDLAVMLGDGELAQLLDDRVVRLLGGRAGRPIDGVRVDALADGGLAAGGLEGRGLAVHEALDGALGGQGPAVVGPLGVGRGDRQGRGRHLKITLDRDDQVVLGLGVILQLVGELVLAGASLGLRASDVVDGALALGETVTRHCHVSLGVPDKRLTVVGLLGGRRRQGQEALSNYEMLRFLTVRVLALGIVNARGSQPDELTVAVILGGDGAGVIRPALAVNAVLDRQGVAVLVNSSRDACLVGVTVVFLLKAVRRPGDIVLVDDAAGNGEPALLVGDVVVLEVRTRKRGRELDSALAGTDQRLGAGVGAALDALALGEGAGGHDEVGRGEGGAVVGLLGVGGLERHVALGDDQLALGRGHVELGGDVVALGVGDLRGSAHGRLVGAGAGAGRAGGQPRNGVLDAVELEDVGLEAGHRVLSAVVGGLVGLGLHLNLTLRQPVVIEGHLFCAVLIDLHRKRIRVIVGIALDRDNVLREVKFFSRNLGCN